MGGGDLNLKKSWHPHTIKNQEKLWKAEQAKTKEEEKLKILQNEKRAERNREDLQRIGKESGVLSKSIESDGKLEWMYKNNKDLINREEYLLGRAIDKSFEVLHEEEQQQQQQQIIGTKRPINHVEHECVPFSIRSYKGLQTTEQVDLQRKVVEDPLMLIKQRELESRRKILENPVKLKQLHRILKTDERMKKAAAKAKKKGKKSKRKHKRRKTTSSSYSDSDLNKKLSKKLNTGLLDAAKHPKGNMHLSKLLDAKLEAITKELDETAKTTKKPKKNRRSDEISSNEMSYRKRKNESFIDGPMENPSEYRSKTLNPFQNRREREGRSRERERHYVGSRSKEREGHYLRSRSRERHGHYAPSLSRERNGHYARSRSREREGHYPRLRSREREGHYPRLRSREREGHYVRSRSRERNGHYARSRSRERNGHYARSRSRERRHYRRSQLVDRRHYSISRSRDDGKQPRIKERKRYESPGRSSNRRQHSRKSYSPVSHRPTKVSEEEKRSKLEEMMSNAVWREQERSQKVRKHREAYAEEEEKHRTTNFDKNFYNKQMKKALDSCPSVGSRLKTNVNNIQRYSGAMDTNFVKK